MPLPPTTLSVHATNRTLERFKVSPEKLTSLMNDGLGKRIGTSIASNLIHRLLWSPDDSDLLVAIQDVLCGTVLTVLPLEMYKRDYADNLSENRVRHVINQMVHTGHIPSELWQPGDKHERVTVYAHLTEIPIAVGLGRWTGEIRTPNLSELGKYTEFWIWVVQRFTERQYEVDALQRVEARFFEGQNWDVPFRIPGKLNSVL